jgi:hypothetical protein
VYFFIIFIVAALCQSEKEVGPCRGYYPRWYFDPLSEECQQFVFGGCRGNRNNFEGKEECEKTCAGLKGKNNNKNISLLYLIKNIY